jgi:hypothetical protein
MAGNWLPLTNQPTFDANAMMLLPDGTVMVQELAKANWWKLAPDASGSYVNGTWSARAAGPNGPTYYASAVLRDGRVLVAGGEDNFANNGVDIDAAEIYDPVADSWTAISTPRWGWIGDAPGCLLPDGRFIMGSINDTRTAIYDPAANAWTAGPDKADRSSEETWTLLPDGSVLTAEVVGHPNAEKYVPATNAWISAGSVPSSADLVISTAASIEIGPALLMNDGRVFAVGASGHTAIYTPGPTPGAPGTWAAGPDFPTDANGVPWRAFDAPAVLLPNGRVLCIAGPARSDGWAGVPSHALEFDGRTLTQAPDPPNAAGSETWMVRLLLLPTGEVLCSARNNNMQVYRPDGIPNPAWAPAITSIPAMIRPGSTIALQGRQLNGLSQANSYGDDAQMATNFPIVRIQSNGRVDYCRTHAFSTMAVATGSDVVSAEADVPVSVPLGSAQLCVIANGIATCTPVVVSDLTQHVNYLGDDNQVHELWWDAAGWHRNNLTLATGAPNAAKGSDLDGYPMGGTQHVKYRGDDNHVHELWWNASGWHHNDLTVAAGAPNAAVASALDGYVLGNTQHVDYRGDDNHVHELWWDPSGWHHHDLTGAASAPNAAQTGGIDGYVLGNTQHVNYLGNDNHVHELWWDPTGWHHNDLTVAAGAPNAAGGSDLDGYAFGGTQHVNYRGDDNHIHELWWDAAGWHHNDLTVAGRGPNAAQTGGIDGYVIGGTQHVNYIGDDNHVHELWWDPTGWHHNDLTVAAGAPNAAEGTDLDGYVLGNTQHVNYRADDDRIHELWWDPTGWHHNNITVAAGAPNAAQVGGLDGYVL